MDSDSITLIIALVLLISFSAFFSAAEMSYSSFSKTKLKILASNGKKRAGMALKLTDNFGGLLSTLLVGNNIVNITAASLATVFFEKIFGDTGIAISTVVMTVVILIFGEISPKTLANEYPEKFAMTSAPLLKVFTYIFWPVNFIFSLWKKLLMHIFKQDNDNSMTEEELITIIEEAENDGSIGEQEGELIRSAIEFNDVDVESILTPRVDIIAIEENTPLSEISELFRNHRFSRLPVYHETIDHIIGILHEKDFNRLLYDGKTDITEVLCDMVCIPEKMKISKLLRVFQEAKVHMAIVVDEFGGTSGVVTLEDVLEGLVGEIWDEHDEVMEDIKKTGDNTYIISCNSSFDYIAEKLKITDEENDSATIGGWVLKELGKIPETGDSFDYDNLHVEITKTENRRALEIKVVVSPNPEETQAV